MVKFRTLLLIGFFLTVQLSVLPGWAYSREEFLIVLPININKADALTLARALSGVGPKKAAAIIDFREQHGDFESIHDLLQVKGIGPGTLSKNQSRMVLE